MAENNQIAKFSKINLMQNCHKNHLFKVVFEIPSGSSLAEFITFSDNYMKSGELVGTLSKNTYKTYNAQIKGFLNWFALWNLRTEHYTPVTSNSLWGLIWNNIYNPFAIIDMYFSIIFNVTFSSIPGFTTSVLGQLCLV